MKFEKYYITDSNNKSNCVIRTFCKIYDKEYSDVSNELNSISKELDTNFNDILTFEEYINRHNTIKIDDYKDMLIKDLKLDNNKYIVFCYDKKDFYHMVPIINNTIYDYSDDSFNLYIINIYKVNP